MIIIAFIQLTLHYLGWLGIALGVIAYLFGNSGRGTELLISGVAVIALKYIIGVIYQFILSATRGSGDKHQ